MRLHTITLEVGDWATVERCRDWYTDHLGLTLSSELPGESVWFESGDTGFGFHIGKGPGVATTLGFEVEDVDAVVERLRFKGLEISDVQQKRWGARSAQAHDPAGHLIVLMTPDG